MQKQKLLGGTQPAPAWAKVSGLPLPRPPASLRAWRGCKFTLSLVEKDDSVIETLAVKTVSLPLGPGRAGGEAGVSLWGVSTERLVKDH